MEYFMETKQENTSAPTNQLSILSLVFGILTLIFFCMGLLPVPLNEFVCFPASAFFGILALLFGMISLNQIRRHKDSGRSMAWTGILIGVCVFICILCMLIVLVSIFMLTPDYFHIPPFLEKYQI
jgi:hypothetical protein